MDATFTEEQQALRDAVRGLLADHCAIERVRVVADGELGVDPELHARLVALGVTDLPGMIELGIVLEECGRSLAPVPLTSSIAIAGTALAVADPDGELTRSMRGGAIVPILRFDDQVVDGMAATHILDVEDELLVAYLADDCERHPVPTMDRTRRLCEVAYGDARRHVIGPAEPAMTLAERRGCVALAHELIGVAQACLDRAVEHARNREQFSRPIGSFQAVAHRCADMFVAVESARGHAYYAAWASDVDASDAALAASRAKAAAADAAVLCAHSAIQVHGGIGFTWEHDLHLYLKRAQSCAVQLGTAARHRQRVADLMGVA